jgi:hypothetical protein
MRRITTLEERRQFGIGAQAGHSVAELAPDLVRGWSVATVRKWRRRAGQGAALASRMGRPPTGAAGTFAPALREALPVWRGAHPGWGAKTLRAQAQHEARFADQPIPSQRSIHRLLQAHGLVRAYAHHSALPVAPQPFPLTLP